MGESKRRQSTTQKFISEHPFCCFCGGQVKAESRDHLPPKCFFDKKHIPDDLIVPACDACNGGSKSSDQIAAFASRIGFSEQSTIERHDFRKMTRAIARNHPEVSQEWLVKNKRGRQMMRFFTAKHGIHYGEPPGAIAFGPNNCKHLNLFAHKFTLGLFYYCTSQILSNKGGYIAFYQPKEVILEHGIPKLILDALGPIDTLRQGRWKLTDQFRYRWGWNADEGVFGHVSWFREAYVVVGFAVNDMSVLKAEEGTDGYLRPSDLFSILEREEYGSIFPTYPARAA